MYLSSFFKIMCILSLISLLVLPVNAALYGGMNYYWGSTTNPASINLGSYSADNSTIKWAGRTSPGGTTGFMVQKINPNRTTAYDLYVRVNGDFVSGNNTIDYSNFKYGNYTSQVGSPRIVPITSFSTTSTLVKSGWRYGSGGTDQYLPIDLYLIVPYGTAPGTYSIKIIHTLWSGSTPPASLLDLDNNSTNMADNTTTNNTTSDNTSQSVNLYL
ncbi:MAG: hypothetical protein ACXVHY_03330 [Methanobacterium sp.]